jgi:hypothetical protein
MKITKKMLNRHQEWAEDHSKGKRLVLIAADLAGVNLQRADLREADLQRADLQRADLRGANLYEANLYGANLYGADLQRADLEEANLQRADLKGANLQRADLREANLQRADLQRADLREADLEGANLEGADLREADLEGANLYNTKIITFQAGKHFAFIHVGDQYPEGNICKIGCKSLSIKEWLSDGKEIGGDENYSEVEIKLYLETIKHFQREILSGGGA